MAPPFMPSLSAGEIHELVELLDTVHSDLHPLCARQGVEVTLSAEKIKEACRCLQRALQFCRTIAHEVDAAGGSPGGLAH